MGGRKLQYPESQRKYKMGVVKLLNKYVPDSSGVLISPFCGRCHVEFTVKMPVKYFADTDIGIISLWQKMIYEDFIPPMTMTYEVYKYIRTYPEMLKPHYAAFLGNAYTKLRISPKGAFGSYSPYTDKKVNTGIRSYKGLIRDIRTLRSNTKEFTFMVSDFRHTLDVIDVPDDSIVYADPPDGYGDFGIDEFFDWVEYARKKHNVFVTLPYNLRHIPKPSKYWYLDTVYNADYIYLYERK